MIQVQVDGSPLQADLGTLSSMGDVLELVKATIDPDSIITSIQFNGESLSDADWTLPLSAHRGRMLQIRTGGKREYLAERIGLAPQILERITEEFADAGGSYRSGFSPNGNSQLGTAVEDLSAFVNWFVALLNMDPPRLAPSQQRFSDAVGQLHKVCEQMLQQQLYNSWWAISETINTKLTPKLNEIRSLCDEISQSLNAPQ